MATTTQSTAAENPSSVSVILDPSRDKRDGPYRFPVAGPGAPKGAKGNDAVNADLELSEASKVALTPGHNLLAWEQYAAIRQNAAFQRCVKRGVVQVILPTVNGKTTKTTADYAPEDVEEIIRESVDVDFLNLSANTDKREGVPEMCLARVKEIEEEIESRRNP